MRTFIEDGYQGGVAVTASDTVNLTFPNGTIYSKGVYVGTTGDISAVMADGSVLLFKNVPVGFHRLAVRRINSTSTTATNLLALY